MTLSEVIRALRARFAQKSISTPELDARLLVGAVMGYDAAQLMANARVELFEHQEKQIEIFAQRREKYESVARILGHRGFWTLDLKLLSATLEPRPDSETLIEAAQDIFKARANEKLRILDLGTGSGALLLALLNIFPNATGVGVDISAQAIGTAQENAQINGYQSRAVFQVGNWFENIDDRFDVIVSNPPYISSSVCDGLPDEVRLYDPRIALDGGVDGLDAYRVIIESASDHLRPDGLLLLEIGYDQEASVSGLLIENGFGQPITRHDLSGHPRALGARFVKA